MTIHRQPSRPRLRLLVLPAVAFIAAASLIVLLWSSDRQKDAAVLRTRTSISANQAALRLEEYISDRLKVMHVLADDLRDRQVVDEAIYRIRVSQILNQFPAFQALSWIDGDGILRWVVPEATNQTVVGIDLNAIPAAREHYQHALATGEMVATPPLTLMQSGRGFATYLPIDQASPECGALNGVFRLGPLIEACFGDGVEMNFHFVIHDGSGLVYASPNAPASSDASSASATLVVRGRPWILDLTPQAHLLTASAAPPTPVSVIGGLLISLGFGWLIWRLLCSRDSLRVRTTELQSMQRSYPDLQFRLATDGTILEYQIDPKLDLFIPPSEFMGRHMQDVLPGKAGRQFADAIAEVARTGDTSIFEYGLVIRDVSRHYEARLIPLNNNELMVIARDITARKESERRQQRLMAELDHRVKNTLAAVMSLAQQTVTRSDSLEDFSRTYIGRIASLASTHEALAAASWVGVDLPEIIRLTVTGVASHADQITATGPPIRLPAEAAAPLGMSLHELTTNALKYGALSAPTGHLSIGWYIDSASQTVTIAWQERGGPPITQEPTPGFGTSLLRGFVEHELRGTLELQFPQEGLACTMSLPIHGTNRKLRLPGASEQQHEFAALDEDV